ncbi:MAG: transferase [Egibacteraceae bacterium]
MISRLAVVDPTAVVEGVEVAEFAVVRRGARVGRGVRIHPHAVIDEHVEVGSDTDIFHGAVVGKEPARVKALARQPTYDSRLWIGERVVIGAHAVVYRGVTIDDDSLIGDGASIREECRVGTSSIIGRHTTLNYNVTVGARCKIMDHCWLAGNMDIGDDVFVSGGVLTANDPSPRGGSGPPSEELRGPVVRNGAVIGVGAILLPGVVVGRDAVVGAGALVRDDVAPGTVVMGTPARFVRHVGERPR